MSSSRFVPVAACAVIALGAVLVTFVVVSGRNDPLPGSEPPVGYEPPPEFVEEVRQLIDAQRARAEAAQRGETAADAPPADGNGPDAGGNAPDAGAVEGASSEAPEGSAAPLDSDASDKPAANPESENATP